VERLSRLLPAAALLAAAVLAATPSAALEPQSNHGAAFLRAGVHARYLGMGGIGAAAASDLGAGYWNPAGLTPLRGLSLTGMITADMSHGRRHAYAAAAWGRPEFAVAVSWISAATNGIHATDASGTYLGDFDFTENAILVSAATRGNAVSVGATGKLVTQDLGTAAPGGGDGAAAGVGLDLGAQFFLTPYLRVGIAAQDLLLSVGDASTDDVDRVPTNLRLGAAAEPACSWASTWRRPATRIPTACTSGGNTRSRSPRTRGAPCAWAWMTGTSRAGSAPRSDRSRWTTRTSWSRRRFSTRTIGFP
jgi:hypothetical protein